MKSHSYRLDRFISKHSQYSIKDTRLLVAQKRICVDGEYAHSVQQKISQFSQVILDGDTLSDYTPVYIVLNKPKGVVSATTDPKHETVLDLIDHPQKAALHIAGRLDLNTTGLVLLTNDGAWSRKISLPATKLEKTYEVTLANPLDERYAEAFRQGIYFSYEGITTLPAKLEVLTDYTARLTLVEGKYHQVKRMFGHFRNEVLALHRAKVGHLTLEGLAQGCYRELSRDELQLPQTE